MKCVHASWILGSVLLLAGCQPVTYQVKITNNSSFTTDFLIESDSSSTPTPVQDLTSGQSTTVSHTGSALFGGADRVTISSGTLVGGEITPIDAQCNASATANDLVTVIKALDGTLTCTVTAGRSAAKVSDDKPARKGK